MTQKFIREWLTYKNRLCQKEITHKSSNSKKYVVLWRKIKSNRFNYCPSQETINSELAESIFYTFAKILSNGPFNKFWIKLDKPGLCFLS